MRQLGAFFYGTDVAVHSGPIKVDAVAFVPLHEVQTLLIEVIEPPMPNLGVGDCIHCQLRCSIAIRFQVKHKREEIVVFSPKWQRHTQLFQPGVFAVENGNENLPRRCLH